MDKRIVHPLESVERSKVTYAKTRAPSSEEGILQHGTPSGGEKNSLPDSNLKFHDGRGSSIESDQSVEKQSIEQGLGNDELTLERLTAFEIERRLLLMMETYGKRKLKYMTERNVFDDDTNQTRVRAMLRVEAAKDIRNVSAYVKRNEDLLRGEYYHKKKSEGKDTPSTRTSSSTSPSRHSSGRGKGNTMENFVHRLESKMQTIAPTTPVNDSDVMEFIEKSCATFKSTVKSSLQEEEEDHSRGDVWYSKTPKESILHSMQFLPQRQASLSSIKRQAMLKGGEYFMATDAKYLETALEEYCNLRDEEELRKAKLPLSSEESKMSAPGPIGAAQPQVGAMGNFGQPQQLTRQTLERQESTLDILGIDNNDLQEKIIRERKRRENRQNGVNSAMQCHSNFMRPIGALPNTPIFQGDWFVPTLSLATFDEEADFTRKELCGPDLMDISEVFTHPNQFGEWCIGDVIEMYEKEENGDLSLLNELASMLKSDYAPELFQARTIPLARTIAPPLYRDTPNLNHHPDYSEEIRSDMSFATLLAEPTLDESLVKLDDNFFQSATDDASELESYQISFIDKNWQHVLEIVRMGCIGSMCKHDATDETWIQAHARLICSSSDLRRIKEDRFVQNRIRQVFKDGLDGDGLACVDLFLRLSVEDDISRSRSAEPHGSHGFIDRIYSLRNCFVHHTG